MTALEDQQNTTAVSPEESKNAPQKTETLGVLLVHGIGSQWRGDTLVRCTTALHNYFRNWKEEQRLEAAPAVPTAELVDTSVAESGPDHPAQARIIFRRVDILNTSWLIAESCWFETYRRPGFYEFLRWALWVLPISVIVHFIPSYGRMWKEYESAARIVRGPGWVKASSNQQLSLAWHAVKLELRLLGMNIKLTLAVILGMLVQLFITILAILAIVPGITRRFAGWVQRKISATLGDSFLFITSPITGAAIVTRVQKDLEWLAARCDRVIVLAHSQGAAVSYKAIERQFWGGHRPQKLYALITYGSGLRKLFDLEINVPRVSVSWIVLCVWTIAAAMFASGLIALFLLGIIPWWITLVGLIVSLVLQTVPLYKLKTAFDDPVILPILWYDYYSSHDPVPNGPVDVKDPLGAYKEPASHFDAKEFKSRQREVVNWRSIFSDHTSYWSSRDDFVDKVVDIMIKASDLQVGFPFDEEWRKISTHRRLWRVTWLSRCRATAGLACLALLFWPRHALESVAGDFRKLAAAVAASLPEKLATWTPDMAPVSDWILGAGGLAVLTYLMFVVALAGWTVWENQEVTRFFQRRPYASIGVATWVFALGWLGVIIAAPSFALAHAYGYWRDIVGVLWAPAALLGWTVWAVHKSGLGLGAPSAWGRILLAYAERIIAENEQDRIWAAQMYFLRSHIYLAMRDFGSDDWARAVLGETRAIEELIRIETSTDPNSSYYRNQGPEIYQKAIEALKRAGRDASEVQSRLDRSKQIIFASS